MLKETEFQKAAFANRRLVDFAGYEVWVIGREDPVLSKLRWARDTRSEMQMKDVATILRNGVDDEYVNLWAKRLGVEDILSDCAELLKKNAELHNQRDRGDAK